MFENQLFELGEVVMTRGIADNVSPMEVAGMIRRHATGDFGDVCDEDKGLNEEAIKEGSRILSVYHVTVDGEKEKVYVITEWDRSVTTVLFWYEY